MHKPVHMHPQTQTQSFNRLQCSRGTEPASSPALGQRCPGCLVWWQCRCVLCQLPCASSLHPDAHAPVRAYLSGCQDGAGVQGPPRTHLGPPNTAVTQAPRGHSHLREELRTRPEDHSQFSSLAPGDPARLYAVDPASHSRACSPQGGQTRAPWTWRNPFWDMFRGLQLN